MKRLVTMIVLIGFGMPAAADDAGSRDVDRQVLGAWQLEFTAPDGVHRNPVVLVGRQYTSYVAWYVADGEPQPFKTVQLQGDKLVGTITPKERPDVTVTCESTLRAADQCEGKATYRTKDGSDSGQWGFIGKRLAMSSFGEVMKWDLSFTTPDDKQYEAAITVVSKNGKMYAWYSSDDLELLARSISVEGDRVEVKIATETPEGVPVEVTFRGTVAGDDVTGDAEYRLNGETGTFPFKAKRAS
ncbi:MAG: hypothetical protein FJ276_19665 [Planctomycetes bacterium]|nr:hypothetical protein [Planctomycetota bacterium]